MILSAVVSPVMPVVSSAVSGSGALAGETGNRYYVSQSTGLDTNDGSIDAPWQTAAKVSGEVFLPGDNIYFNRGDVWNEQLVVPSSGTELGGYITFSAYGTGDKPVFDGTDLALPQWHGLVRSEAKNYIHFDNLRVQNVNLENPLDPPSSNGIAFKNGSYGIVSNCEVNNTSHSGLTFDTVTGCLVEYNDVGNTCQTAASTGETISIAAVTDFIIRYNAAHDNATGGGAGIDMKQGSNSGICHNNEIYNLYSVNGIYVDAWDSPTFDIEIYSNHIHSGLTGSTGIQISSENGGLVSNILVHHNLIVDQEIGFHMHNKRAGEVDPAQDIYVYNNTIVNNGPGFLTWMGGMVFSNPDCTNIVVKNNIFSQNDNYQIGFEVSQNVDQADYTIDYNVIDGDINKPASIDGVTGDNPISIDSSTGDPLFLAPDDYNLDPLSDAVNAADPSVWQGIPNIRDFAGNLVTDGNGNVVGSISCGAYSMDN